MNNAIETAQPYRDTSSGRRPAPRLVVVERADLPLERAFQWERERGGDVFMVQPMGGGRVRELTWADAVGEARRMAAHLRALDLPAGSRVAILSKNCAHFIMMDLAIWMAGHVSVALYPTFSADTIRYILEHCGARVLFVGKLDEWASQRSGVPEAVTCISCALSPENDFPTWEQIIAGTAPLEGEATRSPDDTALLMYTSGSTGRPKGVEHDFHAMAAASKAFSLDVSFQHGDRMLSYLPLAHAFERAVVETPALVFGFKLYFAESLDTFVDDIKRARPTIFHSVPRLWLKFRDGVHQKMPEKKLARLLRVPILGGIVRRKVLSALGLEMSRLAVTGSAPIPAELLEWYRSLGLELLEGYAMTENFSLSHVTRRGKSRPGRVGTAAPDVAVRIADDGEIQVKSPATMKGYYREPELTADTFTDDGFLRTGDRGEVDQDGYLTITGRTKELFKTSKGKYVAPAPIENMLNTSGIVEQSCVMGSGDPAPHAVVMLAESIRGRIAKAEVRAETEAALNALLARINAELPSWERLGCLLVARDEWTIKNELLTPTLKIRRAAIEARYAACAPASGESRVIWEEGPALVHAEDEAVAGR